MRAQGRLTSPEEFGDIIVRESAARRQRPAARHRENGTRFPGLYADGPDQRQAWSRDRALSVPGTNAVDAARGVRKLMEEAKKRFPNDVDYLVSLDTTESVTDGIKRSSARF